MSHPHASIGTYKQSGKVALLFLILISDPQVIYEKKASAEQIQKARKLRLPDNFYLYTEKPECSGCRGCHVDDDPSADGVLTTLLYTTPTAELTFANAMFSGGEGISFASLAGKGSSFKVTNENFTFAGAGAKLFNTTRMNGKGKL